MTAPDLTILIGPYTRLALAVNASVRRDAGALAERGVTALPTRVASPAVRDLAIGEGAPDDRRSAFQNVLKGRSSAVFSALNFLGAPRAAIAKRELFPDMAAMCLGLAETLQSPPRLVLAVEPLDQFFASVGSEALARRVSATPWEVLYEIAWAELAGDIIASLPGVELCVMTPETALCRPHQLATVLFGDAADATDPETWRVAHLSPEGEAALAQLEPEQASESILIELGQKLGNGPDDARMTSDFGIDRLTRTLLAQRFEEDLALMSDLPGVRML